MKKLLACTALVFGLAGTASAGMIEYDFTGGSGTASSYDFTVDGVTTTATATWDGILFASTGDVSRSSQGIGAKNHWLDSSDIDGSIRDDYLTLTFADTVELLGFTFGNHESNDEFDLYVDGAAVGYNFETTDGLAAFAPTTYSGTSFTVRANQSNDDFVLASMKINVASVPEPGTLALLGFGLAGLGLVRRKQAA